MVPSRQRKFHAPLAPDSWYRGVCTVEMVCHCIKLAYVGVSCKCIFGNSNK